MTRIFAVAANTFRETVRERILYNLIFFAIVMMLSGFLLRELSIRQDQKIIKDVALAAMDAFGTLIALFVGVSLVSKEIERRSLYPLLAKPLTRSEFLLGKFLGLAVTLLANVAVMTVGLYLTLFLTHGRLDPELLKGVYGIYLGMLLAVGVALLFSAITSPAMAAVCSVCLVIAGRLSDVLANMRDVVPGPAGVIVQGLHYVIPNYALFDVKNAVVYGDPVSAAQLAGMSVYAAAYLVTVLLLTAAVFRRREL